MPKMTYLGHACVQFHTDAGTVLIDPFLSGNPQAAAGPADVAADFILLTHGHGDHVGDCVSIARRAGALAVANFEIAAWLGKQGVRHTHPMHLGGSFKFPFGRVKMTIAHHGSQLPDGSNGGSPGGFLIHFNDGKSVYHAGDTALFGDMKLYGEEGIDLALLPIGDNFTMGPADALRAARLLTPKAVVPIHYDTFDLIKQDAAAFAADVTSQTGTACRVMSPGESIDV